MRLVLRSSVREHHNDFVVRESHWGLSALWLVFFVLGVAWCATPVIDMRAIWFGPLFGVPCLLVAGLTASGVVRSWRGSWWILRVRRDSLVLGLRSKLNRDLPDEWANVLVVERQDVRRVTAERLTSNSSSTPALNAAPRVRLSFELAASVPAEVLRSLERECDPRIRGRTHFHAVIATVERANVLDITWSGPSVGLRPRLRTTLRELGRMGYPVEREVRTVKVDASLPAGDERDPRIDQLVSSGDKLRAIALWRATHGGSLAEAKAAVEKRTKRPAA